MWWWETNAVDQLGFQELFWNAMDLWHTLFNWSQELFGNATSISWEASWIHLLRLDQRATLKKKLLPLMPSLPVIPLERWALRLVPQILLKSYHKSLKWLTKVDIIHFEMEDPLSNSKHTLLCDTVFAWNSSAEFFVFLGRGGNSSVCMYAYYCGYVYAVLLMHHMYRERSFSCKRCKVIVYRSGGVLTFPSGCACMMYNAIMKPKQNTTRTVSQKYAK